MQRNLPGMKIQTLDCTADEEKMNKMKTEQRERKKAEGKGIQFIQDSDGEISSSDEEELDRAEAGGRKGSRKQRVKKKARQPKTKLGQWVEGDRERERREEEDDMAGRTNGQATA